MNTLHKVLVVDDDPVVGKSFSRVLSQKGYLVITAQDAQEALRKMQEGDYDVVVTDIRMPGMSGIELAERVKASRPWTPVVIVTGYGTTESEERARSAGVTSFLHKPLSPEMIEDSMTKALLEALPHAGLDAAASPVVVAEPVPLAKVSVLKRLVVGLAAPLIGLLYVAVLPIVGILMLAWLGAKALAKKSGIGPVPRALKNVGLMISAPIVGLAYVALLPLIGTAMLILVWAAGTDDSPLGEP